MVNQSPHILMLLGGTWHDFDGFERSVGGVLRDRGAKVEPTYDLASLKHLNDFDVVLNYTCLSQTREDGTPLERRFTDDDVVLLENWVSRGRGLLMAHCGTVACQASPKLAKLVGGVFIRHPPALTFEVFPTTSGHQVTAGVRAFEVRDEFYFHRVDTEIAVHMVALHDGVAHPMVWTRQARHGRVAVVAPGHDGGVWVVPQYQQLITQSVDWLAQKAGKGNL